MPCSASPFCLLNEHPSCLTNAYWQGKQDREEGREEVIPKEAAALHEVYEAIKLEGPSHGQATPAAEAGAKAQAWESHSIQESSERAGLGSQTGAREVPQQGDAPYVWASFTFNI